MAQYDTALKLGAAIRILTDDEFASKGFDANSTRAFELVQSHPPLPIKADTLESFACEWESSLAHLIFTGWGRWDTYCLRMIITVSHAYAEWNLRRMCESQEEQQSFLRLAALLLGKEHANLPAQ